MTNDESGYHTLLRAVSEDLKISVDSYTKVYNVKGNEVSEEDFYHVTDNDVFYVAKNGRPFSWQSYLNCYDRVKRLGSGGFGSVYLMRHKLSNFELAAKFIDISEYADKADMAEEIMKEASLLMKLKHDNILMMKNAFFVKKNLVLMTELLKGGELLKYIDKRAVPLTEDEALQVMF